MIGCETLCGNCFACGALVWALNALSAGYPLAEAVARRSIFGKAVLDPNSLAELLARALRGRGVDDARGEGTDAEGGYVGLTWPSGTYVCAAGSPMGPARAALSRLLAAVLCGPEEALRLLEGT